MPNRSIADEDQKGEQISVDFGLLFWPIESDVMVFQGTLLEHLATKPGNIGPRLAKNRKPLTL